MGNTFSVSSPKFCMRRIRQNSLEVHPRIVIGSFLVGILPFGPFKLAIHRATKIYTFLHYHLFCDLFDYSSVSRATNTE